MEYNKTIFCDIDGTLIQHVPPDQSSLPTFKATPLPNAVDSILDWNKKGYVIILTTGRKESQRELTVKQLQEIGIFYDQLVMGLGRGERVIINDRKYTGEEMARAVNVDRNKGLVGITL